MMDDDKTIHEEGEEVDSPPTSQDKAEIEKIEEQKLKSKFPGRQLRHFHPYYVIETWGEGQIWLRAPLVFFHFCCIGSPK